jgi:predicted protein tyrosine phosphatase
MTTLFPRNGACSNPAEAKFYVVNEAIGKIDSGPWTQMEALERAMKVERLGGKPKVMTHPRVGDVALDPRNPDHYGELRRSNPEEARDFGVCEVPQQNPRRDSREAPRPLTAEEKEELERRVLKAMRDLNQQRIDDDTLRYLSVAGDTAADLQEYGPSPVQSVREGPRPGRAPDVKTQVKDITDALKRLERKGAVRSVVYEGTVKSKRGGRIKRKWRHYSLVRENPPAHSQNPADAPCIRVLSRLEMDAYFRAGGLDDVHALVSIGDPGQSDPWFLEGAAAQGVEVLRLEFLDTDDADDPGAPDAKDIQLLTDFLDEVVPDAEDACIFIHCEWGIYRSGAAAQIAYEQLGFLPVHALDMVREDRPQADPNTLMMDLYRARR